MGNVTNRISGGSFLPMNGAYTTKSSIYFGQYSGKILGTLRNEISGGTFDLSSCSGDAVYMGCRNPNCLIGKVENVIGEKDSQKGPMFLGAHVRLGASWAQIGASATYKAMPSVEECTDEVVLSNTIYGGFFENNIYGASTAATDTGNAYYSFVLGSVENNIYGGQLRGTFYAAGTSEVFGKVTTNIYGGAVSNVYGGGNSAVIHDGVELNLYGVSEYFKVYSKNAWHYWAGAYNASIPVPQTEGRPSVKLTVCPTGEMVLNTPLCAGCKTGNVLGETVVEVSGGTYPKGFRVDGVTLEEALKEGYMPIDTSGKVLVPAKDATETGTAQVSVQRVYWGYSSCDVTALPGYTTNANVSATRPDHVWENGVCSGCGAMTGNPMDLDGDGNITAFDAQILAEAKAGWRTLPQEQWDLIGDLTPAEIINAILNK